MSTSRRTLPLRRSRASESLRTLAWDTSTPSTSPPSYRRDRHALQAGDLSASHGTSSDRSISVNGLSSRADDLSTYGDFYHAAHGSTHAEHGSVRVDQGSSHANHLSFPADLPEQTNPLPRWQAGPRRRYRALGMRFLKDAVLAVLRCTLELVKQRSLVSISSRTTQEFGDPGESRVGESRGVYAREYLAPIADSLQHSQSLSSELRDWAAWDRAGLVGSNYELSAAAGGLGEPNGVLEQNTRGLDEHTGAQDVHAGVLGDVIGALDDGPDVLNNHIGALDNRPGPLDEQTGGLDDDGSALDEYTDALDEHPGTPDNDISNPVNDVITKILRLNDEAIRKASVSMRIHSSRGVADPSWGVWRRDAWYVAEDDEVSLTSKRDGISSSERDGSSSSKRDGPSTSKTESRPTPSPVSLNAGDSLQTPIFDSPETYSTQQTTPSPKKAALPHASPHHQPSPRQPSPPRSSTSPRRSSPLTQVAEDLRRSPSPLHPRPSVSVQHSCAALVQHSCSAPIQHSRPNRANTRNVLDALPALSRGQSAPAKTAVLDAITPNTATPSGAEASVRPPALAMIPSSSERPERPTSAKEQPTPPTSTPPAPSTTAPAADPAPAADLAPSGPPRNARADPPRHAPAEAARQPEQTPLSFEILLSPSSSLRTLPCLAQPAGPTTFKLSQVPLGMQKTLQDAEHLARKATEGISEPASSDAARRATLDDDALRQDALDDIARAIHNTRRMLHRNRTTEIKLDKDPKRVDAKCYTEGLRRMMGTCAAFTDRLAHDPGSARACGTDWLCILRDGIVAQEASIRSALHALVNHEISEKLTALEDLALPMS